MNREFRSFEEFYPFYLDEHAHPISRRLHFLGTSLVLLIVIAAIWSGNYGWILITPVVGYGFAWVGHFFFEKNRPATFTHPIYSLAGDWVMWKDVIIGRISLR